MSSTSLVIAFYVQVAITFGAFTIFHVSQFCRIKGTKPTFE